MRQETTSTTAGGWFRWESVSAPDIDTPLKFIISLVAGWLRLFNGNSFLGVQPQSHTVLSPLWWYTDTSHTLSHGNSQTQMVEGREICSQVMSLKGRSAGEEKWTFHTNEYVFCIHVLWSESLCEWVVTGITTGSCPIFVTRPLVYLLTVASATPTDRSTISSSEEGEQT